jgi:hypothetical protein
VLIPMLVSDYNLYGGECPFSRANVHEMSRLFRCLSGFSGDDVAGLRGRAIG